MYGEYLATRALSLAVVGDAWARSSVSAAQAESDHEIRRRDACSERRGASRCLLSNDEREQRRPIDCS